MANSDIEKGAGDSDVQQPNLAHTTPHDDFLPAYENQVNENLRNFGQPVGQANLQAFDHIQDAPKRGRRGFLKREYIILAVVVLLIVALALPIGIVYILRNGESEHKVAIPSSASTTLEQEAETAIKTVTMQTREAKSTISQAPLTTTVVPSITYVTVTSSPTSEISVITLTTTLTPKPSPPSITKETETVTEKISIPASPASTPTDTITTISTATLTAEKFSLTLESSESIKPETTTVLSVTTMSPTPEMTGPPFSGGITIVPITPTSSSSSTSSVGTLVGEPFRLLCGPWGAACP